MSLGTYLPSAQFTLIVASVVFAGGLVILADYATTPQSYKRTLVTTTSTIGVESMDWKESLAVIQGKVELPDPLDTATLESLRAEAKTDNLTGSVARNILINLTEAKSQGLGSDFPTQERLIASAVAEATVERGAPIYASKDLTIVKESSESLAEYGNTLALVLQAYPETSVQETLIAVSTFIDKGTKDTLTPLETIEAEYKAMTNDLLHIPVPTSLAPFHLQVTNNIARITSLYIDFRAALKDPLRGIGALKLYQSLMQETGYLLTNSAQVLKDRGILFTSDEPGSVWSLLLTPQDL